MKTLERALLTTPQAANTLGYTVQHTRLLIRQGQLRAAKLGRDWMIDQDALNEFIAFRAQANGTHKA